MSIKTVIEFFEKVAIDNSIQEKIKKVDKKRNDALHDALNDIVIIAKSEGFNFSTEDYVEARKEAYFKKAGSVMSESEGQKEKQKEWEDCWLISGCGWNLLWAGPPQCGQGVAHIPPAPTFPEE